jgi:hypothetical protein
MITETAITTTAITAGALEGFSTWITSLGGLSDLLVALGSSGLLVVLYKVAGLIKYLRSNDFEKHAITLAGGLVDQYSKNPELIKSIAASASQVKEVQDFLNKARDAKNDILLELEGRRIDIIAKIKSGLFEGDELTMLHEYLAKLEAKLNETPDKV